MSGPNYRGRRDAVWFYVLVALAYLTITVGAVVLSRPRCETLQERAGDLQKAERER